MESNMTEAEARRRRARKRRRRALRDLLLRMVLLIAVVYVLFFQFIGVLSMPNDDMYPRIDAGDLVIYYRLDNDVRAQDVIAFEKDAASMQSYAAPSDADLVTIEDGATVGSVADLGPAATPDPSSALPSERVSQGGLGGSVNRFLYDLSIRLRLRRPEGRQLYVCRVVACEGDTVEIPDGGGLIVNGNAMIESNIFSETTEYLGFTEYPLTLGPGECFVLADKRNGGADSRFFGPVKREEILGTVITIARRNNL